LRETRSEESVHHGIIQLTRWGSPQSPALTFVINHSSRTVGMRSYKFSLERMMYDELATTSNSTFHMRIAELFCSLNGECGVYIPGTTTSAYADAEHISNARTQVQHTCGHTLTLSSFRMVCCSKRVELLVYDLRPITTFEQGLLAQGEREGRPGRCALNERTRARRTRTSRCVRYEELTLVHHSRSAALGWYGCVSWLLHDEATLPKRVHVRNVT
jgi:hypothetical protein